MGAGGRQGRFVPSRGPGRDRRRRPRWSASSAGGPDGQHHAAVLVGDHPGHLGLGRADVQGAAPAGHDAEQLAGHHDAGEPVVLAHQVHVAQAQQFFEVLPRLVALFHDVRQPCARVRRRTPRRDRRPPPAKTKPRRRVIPQQPGRLAERLRLVGQAQVARVHHHELVVQLPRVAVAARRSGHRSLQRGADRPHAGDLDFFGGHALALHPVPHAAAQHHHPVGPAHTGSVQPGHGAAHPRRLADHAGGGEHLGVQVHRPVDVPGAPAPQPADHRADQPDVGRAGEGDDDLGLAAGQPGPPRGPQGGHVKQRRVEAAPEDLAVTEPRRPHPPHAHPIDLFVGHVGGAGLAVKRFGRDHRHLVPLGGEVLGHVLQAAAPTRRRRGVNLVDEENAHAGSGGRGGGAWAAPGSVRRMPGRVRDSMGTTPEICGGRSVRHRFWVSAGQCGSARGVSAPNCFIRIDFAVRCLARFLAGVWLVV